jgi:hypothetical protein
MRSSDHCVRPILRRAALLLAGLLLSGCSLLAIKSPEKPLSAREQQARLLTRDYAAHFVSTITHLLDDAAPNASDPAVRLQAIRLKLSAVTEITRSSTGLSPIASLLDTWSFAVQFRDFLVTGAGADILGSAQADVRLGATQLADEADALAKQVAGDDYPRYRTFVLGYAQRNPLESVDIVRPSVLAAWTIDERDDAPLRVEGTVAQALGDLSDRVRIYGERVPTMSLWQTELALNRAGFDDASYRVAFRDIDAQLERIAMLADSSPTLAHQAISELRAGLLASSDRLDGSWMQTLRAMHVEREALAANIATEREGITSAFDTERARVAEDAERIAAHAVDTSWQELRKLVRETLLLLILLTLLVLGLPFGAGYLLGRRQGGSASGERQGL